MTFVSKDDFGERAWTIGSLAAGVVTVYHIDPQLRTPGGDCQTNPDQEGDSGSVKQTQGTSKSTNHPSGNMTIDIQGVLWQSLSKLQWPG